MMKQSTLLSMDMFRSGMWNILLSIMWLLLVVIGGRLSKIIAIVTHIRLSHYLVENMMLKNLLHTNMFLQRIQYSMPNMIA